MPNKKIDQTPAAPERPIVCAFCQKELDSLIDEFTFIGIGKWRDGPALFHAACSSKTQDGHKNRCFLNGMSWAMKFTKEQPALLTYQEWKARPIRRSVKATRAENGKYELLLLESHLNCIYFLEMKKSLTVSKAKELVLRWQDEWGLDVESVPDIERLERDASDANVVKSIQEMALDESIFNREMVELPEELKKEMDRHSAKYLKHLFADIEAGGDDCKSCCIIRGIRKLCVIQLYLPLIYQSLGMIDMVNESAYLDSFRGSCRKVFDNTMELLCKEMSIKHGDDSHNKAAQQRNLKDIRLAKSLMEKHRVNS